MGPSRDLCGYGAGLRAWRLAWALSSLCTRLERPTREPGISALMSCFGGSLVSSSTAGQDLVGGSQKGRTIACHVGCAHCECSWS